MKPLKSLTNIRQEPTRPQPALKVVRTGFGDLGAAAGGDCDDLVVDEPRLALAAAQQEVSRRRPVQYMHVQGVTSSQTVKWFTYININIYMHIRGQAANNHLNRSTIL